MRSRVPADEVLAMFAEGVDAFCAETDRLDDAGWTRPACGEWDATQLARHVLAVIGWYHDWLDRAEAGDATPAFPIEDLAARNARDQADMAATGGLDGPEAAARFRERAARYVERLQDTWELPFGYPRGTVTAGLHAGMACFEWHAHTWDLAHADGRDHRPPRPERLYLAVADCLTAAATGVVAADEPPQHPWGTLLAWSGRR